MTSIPVIKAWVSCLQVCKCCTDVLPRNGCGQSDICNKDWDDFEQLYLYTTFSNCRQLDSLSFNYPTSSSSRCDSRPDSSRCDIEPGSSRCVTKDRYKNETRCNNVIAGVQQKLLEKVVINLDYLLENVDSEVIQLESMCWQMSFTIDLLQYAVQYWNWSHSDIVKSTLFTKTVVIYWTFTIVVLFHQYNANIN